MREEDEEGDDHETGSRWVQVKVKVNHLLFAPALDAGDQREKKQKMQIKKKYCSKKGITHSLNFIYFI